MSQYLLFLVLGLGVGAIYVGLTMSIVLTYQGTGVINFAAAAMATVPLYVFSDLETGKLTLPLPLPSFDSGAADVGPARRGARRRRRPWARWSTSPCRGRCGTRPCWPRSSPPSA